jgi:hypothetical protein
VIAGIITRATAAGQDLLMLSRRDRRTVLDALDVAADYKRDRAALLAASLSGHGSATSGVAPWLRLSDRSADSIAVTNRTRSSSEAHAP